MIMPMRATAARTWPKGHRRKMMNIAEEFESASSETGYTPHKVFKGVYLKHLVTGGMTDGRISSHLVKIDPFCTLDVHTHPEQVEIHEVIQGTGECVIGERKIRYVPGTAAVIPQNTPHKVAAGKDGLYILAKFTPALL
jgi:quercetin dioxygenase-like cupin family protein